MSKPPFPFRALAETLLGPTLLAYLLHLRPMEWPIMTAHFLLGTLLAVGWSLPWRAVLGGWLVFVVLLNGGTLAINSAFDQDEGDVGYLKAPPKPPKYLFHVSLAMLGISLVWGLFFPPLFAWSNGLCVVMAIFYSVPPVRLKARAGWDILINSIGFGALTPAAGWGLTGRPATPSFYWICAGFALLFGALYPLTQIYQIQEDRARGDRTLVIQLGEAWSLWLALILMGLAHLAFGWALVLQQASLTQLAGLLPSFLGWLVVLVPWLLHWKQWAPARHEKGMYQALAVWALTDISLLWLAWPRAL